MYGWCIWQRDDGVGPSDGGVRAGKRSDGSGVSLGESVTAENALQRNVVKMTNLALGMDEGDFVNDQDGTNAVKHTRKKKEDAGWSETGLSLVI